jgi:hypothetical protein
MNSFVIGMLIGLGISLVGTPLVLWIIYLISEAKVRRNIKRQIVNGNFLKPIDKRDYDEKMWEDIYKNNTTKEDLEDFEKQIFKRGKFKTEED